MPRCPDDFANMDDEQPDFLEQLQLVERMSDMPANGDYTDDEDPEELGIRQLHNDEDTELDDEFGVMDDE